MAILTLETYEENIVPNKYDKRKKQGKSCNKGLYKININHSDAWSSGVKLLHEECLL